jgi:hypothetical protein
MSSIAIIPCLTHPCPSSPLAPVKVKYLQKKKYNYMTHFFYKKEEENEE